MGSALHKSKVTGVALGAQWYTCWTLDQVKAADRRMRIRRPQTRVGARRNTTCIPLSRREFWEVFTDYSCIIDGKFLQLPIQVFHYFATTDLPLPPGIVNAGEPRVNAMEIMLVLALFCDGSVEQQMRFCFELFDADKNGCLTQDEMLTFFQVLMTAATRIRLVTDMPSSEELASIAENMFHLADEDGGGTVSCTEFVSWARNHVVTRKLLGTLHQQQQQAVTLRAGQRPSARNLRSKLASHAQQRTCGVWLLRDLQRDTGLEIAELRDLKAKFSSAQENPRGIDKPTFAKVMRTQFPELGKAASLDRLFDNFDTDKSGTIDLKEFVIGMSMLTHGTIQDKLLLLFELFDRTHAGLIDIQDLASLAREGSEQAVEASAMALELLEALDVNKDGRVSKAEFRAALKHPVMQHCFSRVLGVAPTIDGVEKLIKSGKFTTRYLTKRFAELGFSSTGFGSRELNVHDFRKFMMTEFNLTPDSLPMINRMFQAFDKDASATISVQEMFSGLSQLTASSLEEKANFYFRVHDIQGTGTLDTSDIVALLNGTKSAADATHDNIRDILRYMDRNGDGKLSFNEFQQAMRATPQLVEYFGRLLGIDNKQVQARKDATGLIKILRKAKHGENLHVASAPVLPTVREMGGGASPSLPALSAQQQTSARVVAQAIRRFERLSLPAMSSTIMAVHKELKTDENAVMLPEQAFPHCIVAKSYGKALAVSLRSQRQQLRQEMHDMGSVQQVLERERERLAAEAAMKLLAAKSPAAKFLQKLAPALHEDMPPKVAPTRSQRGLIPTRAEEPPASTGQPAESSIEAEEEEESQNMSHQAPEDVEEVPEIPEEPASDKVEVPVADTAPDVPEDLQSVDDAPRPMSTFGSLPRLAGRMAQGNATRRARVRPWGQDHRVRARTDRTIGPMM